MTTTGCESGGDYVLDIATYVAAALEFQEQEHEIYCETLLRQVRRKERNCQQRESDSDEQSEAAVP